VSLFEGNTADCETLLAQVQRSRHNFEIQAAVLVGQSAVAMPKPRLLLVLSRRILAYRWS
jgi:hypothetical protein